MNETVWKSHTHAHKYIMPSYFREIFPQYQEHGTGEQHVLWCIARVNDFPSLSLSLSADVHTAPAHCLSILLGGEPISRGGVGRRSAFELLINFTH